MNNKIDCTADHDCIDYIEDSLTFPYHQKFYVSGNRVMSPEEFDKKRRRVYGFKFFPKWYEAGLGQLIVLLAFGIIAGAVLVILNILNIL